MDNRHGVAFWVCNTEGYMNKGASIEVPFLVGGYLGGMRWPLLMLPRRRKVYCLRR